MRRIVVAVTMISPVAVGMLRVFDDATGQFGAVLTVVFLALGLAAGTVLLFASNDAAEVADELLKQLDDNRDLRKQRDALTAAIGRASARHVFLQGLSDLTYAAPAKPSSEDVKRLNELVFDQLLALHDDLFEFTPREKWGYGIYYFNPDSGRLECRNFKRAWRDAKGHQPRSWEPGKGHAGVAFTREGDLVYGDAQDSIVQQLIDPGDQAGANDKYYRSVASIPIFDPTNSVLGVVIATSNRKGRFMPDQKAEIEPLRDWAKFNANLIARQR
jgi:hypothetical protein